MTEHKKQFLVITALSVIMFFVLIGVYFITSFSIDVISQQIGFGNYYINEVISDNLFGQMICLGFLLLIFLITFIFGIIYVCRTRVKKVVITLLVSYLAIIGVGTGLSFNLYNHVKYVTNEAMQKTMDIEMQKGVKQYYDNQLANDLKTKYDGLDIDNKAEFVNENGVTIEQAVSDTKKGDYTVAKKVVGEEKVKKTVEDGKKDWKTVFTIELDKTLASLSEKDKQQLTKSFGMPLKDLRKLAVSGDLKSASKLLGKEQTKALIKKNGGDPNSYLIKLVLGW